MFFTLSIDMALRQRSGAFKCILVFHEAWRRSNFKIRMTPSSISCSLVVLIRLICVPQIREHFFPIIFERTCFPIFFLNRLFSHVNPYSDVYFGAISKVLGITFCHPFSVGRPGLLALALSSVL
jgi:hypothetical protein